ncbi:hypothetical protein FRC03_001234 [Tulasnella sp. 419]|nr:hypothetical protein FRC03_001234 [Tulasnella sp. 419]
MYVAQTPDIFNRYRRNRIYQIWKFDRTVSFMADTSQDYLIYPKGSIYLFCAKYLLARYFERNYDQSLERHPFHHESETTDNEIFVLLEDLESFMASARWGVVYPSCEVHLFHIEETYEAFNELLTEFDFTRLWKPYVHHETRFKEKSIEDLGKTWKKRHGEWRQLLTNVLARISKDFYGIYDNMDEGMKRQYAEFTEAIPRENYFF